MKRKHLFLGIIILLAFILRFWQLGATPSSPDWDEVSLGYNAYSIIQTGKDEYGQPFPIVLRSFEDYKPALYSYIAIPFVKLFGLNIFAVRLPSLILGLITLIATYFLVKELFEREDLAIVSTFLLAISPWHIQFSRVAFESNLGLTLTILFILFFLKGIKKPWLLSLSAFFAALALYSYQAEKLLVPLFAVFLILIFRKKLIYISPRFIFVSIAVLLVISLPILIFTFTNKNALSRAQATSFLNNPLSGANDSKKIEVDKKNSDVLGIVLDNRRINYAKEFISNYLWHYNLNWLFVRGESANPYITHGRHQPPGMGNLYLFELPFILAGIYLLLFSDYRKTTKTLIIGWLLLVPIPAALTWDVPNSVRTLSFLPTFQILSALGLLFFYRKIVALRYKIAVLTIVVSIALFNFVYYLDQYFVQYNYFSSKSWQYGYSVLIPKLNQISGNYQRIVVSNTENLEQSYIFFLFYLKYPPQIYQMEKDFSHSFSKYKFGFSKESLNKGDLLVLSPLEYQSVEGKLMYIDEVLFKNGERAFVIAKVK